MNSKQFLQYGGIVLVLLAIVGFIVPTIGGSALYFDSAENWAHLVLGVVALVLAPLALGELKLAKHWRPCYPCTLIQATYEGKARDIQTAEH
jgi:hypothetical protein